MIGDAVAVAVAEHWLGAARGSDNVLGMVVSTGVGGGLVLGGCVCAGATGNAGHIGHVSVDPNGPACVCGGVGCLEAIASGPSIAAWARERGLEAPGAREVAALAERGNPIATAAYERAGGGAGPGRRRRRHPARPGHGRHRRRRRRRGQRALRAARDQLRPLRGAGLRGGTADPARPRSAPAPDSSVRPPSRSCPRSYWPRRATRAGLVVTGPDVEVPAGATCRPSRRCRPPRELLRGVARYTPMESSRPLAQKVGGPVYLKCENLQRTGSFKIRGAYMRIARLHAGAARAGRRRGVGRQPRPGRRARRVAARHHGDGLHAGGRVDRRSWPPPARTARDVELVGATLDDALEAAHRVRAADGRRAGAPVRPSRRAARSGHRRARDPRTGAGRRDGRGRGRRRGAAQRRVRVRQESCARTCGSSACRPSRPPPGQARSTPGGPSGCARCPRWRTVSPSGSRPR